MSYENEVLSEMYEQLQESRDREGQLTNALHGQMSVFGEDGQDNLIRWQLDLREDLDRIYHLLKGDRVDYDSDGNMTYVIQENPKLRPFNEFGVQLIMNIMSYYLNRNTILSNYDETTINWKVVDIANEITDLIFNRYEDMMVTIETEDPYEIREHLREKIKLYPLIVKELTDTIHSAYLRAFNGGERESLRTARTVTQSEPLYRQPQQPVSNSGSGNMNKTKWYNPGSW